MAQIITLNGFIHSRPAQGWETKNLVDGMKFTFLDYADTTGVTGYSLVCPHDLTFDLPDSFDPRVEFVKTLEAKKREVMAEFQARMTEIDSQIAKYTALTYVEAV